jgi:hypothetical protein
MEKEYERQRETERKSVCESEERRRMKRENSKRDGTRETEHPGHPETSFHQLPPLAALKAMLRISDKNP